jgi:hypothetical protein
VSASSLIFDFGKDRQRCVFPAAIRGSVDSLDRADSPSLCLIFLPTTAFSEPTQVFAYENVSELGNGTMKKKQPLSIRHDRTARYFIVTPR